MHLLNNILSQQIIFYDSQGKTVQPILRLTEEDFILFRLHSRLLDVTGCNFVTTYVIHETFVPES
jgi:hypothetical protein